MAVLNRISTPIAIAMLLLATFCVPLASGKTAYDYLLFVVQWPFAVCANAVCTLQYPPPDDFKIHGLWPANFSGASLNCSGVPFNRSEMDEQKELKTDLRDSWPNLINSISIIFWENEYNKHGLCCDNIFNQTMYFQTAHQMWSRHHVELMFEDAGYKPGNWYQSADLQAAVKNKTTKDPALRCIVVRGMGTKLIKLLREVVICYDHDGKYVIDCNSYLSTTCTRKGTTIFYKDL